MADSDPIFFIKIEFTGKKFHKFMYGSYTLFRRDVNPSGFASFSCAEKDCSKGQWTTSNQPTDNQ